MGLPPYQPMTRHWVIFYDDGTTFDSDDGTWENAPGWGIQAVVYEDARTGWSICHGHDYFRLADEGEPVGFDLSGLFDYVTRILGTIKVGRMLSYAEYQDVYQRAKLAMAGLKKTGWLRRERRAD